MLTLIPLLNPPPRGWGSKAKAKKSRRKPVRDTSAKRTRTKRRAKQEVGVAKKKKRRRGSRGRRSVKTTVRRRRRKSTSGRRRGRRGAVRSKARRGGRRRRRSNPGALDQLSAAFGAATRAGRRRRKGGKKTSSRRRGRRSVKRLRAVYVRRRRGPKKGQLRRVNPRGRRRGRRGSTRRLGRRSNPGRGGYGGGIMGSVRRTLALNTVQIAAGVGIGILVNQAAPALLRRFLPSVARQASGVWGEAAVGLVGNILVGAGLSALGYGQLGFKTIIGGVVATGGRGLKLALASRRSAPALMPAAPGAAGMGSIVSPEAMIESQALLSGMGDFVQLSGGIPRRDFRGVGDYVEFRNQAAGAQAMASQLATQEVFSPGADEKF